MRSMRLVGVRSTTPGSGLVAILIEEGGPAMIAVPVTAREGVSLASPDTVIPPSWTGLLDSACRYLGARPHAVELDVDPDARMLARLLLHDATGTVSIGALDARSARHVPCAPGDALVLASAAGLPVRASGDLLRLHAVDLEEDSLQERLARWRREIAAGDGDALST